MRVKVEMLTVARGSDFNADPGDVVKVSAEFAAQLIENGYARPHGTVPETATEAPAEDAAEKSPPKTRRKK